MVKPTLTCKQDGVPVLAKKDIEAITQRILLEFDPTLLASPKEIDVDALAELYFNVTLDYQYLTNCGIILGMTAFNDASIPVYDPFRDRAEYFQVQPGLVILDKTLLEENQEHRYRFTLAHELSHWLFHDSYYSYCPSQSSFFEYGWEGTEEPLIGCRVNDMNSKKGRLVTAHDWLEWQANFCGSCLLMPALSVQKLMKANGYFYNRNCSYAEERAGIALVSEVFNVSLEAAGIRLHELGYFQADLCSALL